MQLGLSVQPASKKLPSELPGLGPGIHNLRTLGISALRFLFYVSFSEALATLSL